MILKFKQFINEALGVPTGGDEGEKSSIIDL